MNVNVFPAMLVQSVKKVSICKRCKSVKKNINISIISILIKNVIDIQVSRIIEGLKLICRMVMLYNMYES